MAILPSLTLRSFQFFYKGEPYIRIEASETADTTLVSYTEFAYLERDGFFRAARGSASVVVANNVYAKINGEWTQIQEIYFNLNGTWKRVSNDKFYVKQSGSWRS